MFPLLIFSKVDEYFLGSKLRVNGVKVLKKSKQVIENNIKTSLLYTSVSVYKSNITDFSINSNTH